MELTDDVKFVKGVGPNRVKLLNKLNIYNLEDLITYYPREYEDRSKPKKIADTENGEECLIEGIVTSHIKEIRTHRKNMIIYKLIVRDDTDSCELVWYNQSYLKKMFRIGETYKFFGRINKRIGQTEMVSPVYDLEGNNKNTGRIIPIYPLTYSLSQNTLRHIIEEGLKQAKDKIAETLPEYILEEYKLMKLKNAMQSIHFPKELKDFGEARNRLAFEELLTMQLLLLNLKNKYKNTEKGIKFDSKVKMSDVINDLPFKLTKAQTRVLEEIDSDMESDKAMNRLLQGDVGSGKTIVSIIAAYKAVKSGYQMAMMAPTSILASQHLENFKNVLEKYDIKCELLLGNTTKKKKEDILSRLKNGEIDIIIGTHSLLEENVIFKNLGLVVTDEQHRFGVHQRANLQNKGVKPDVLFMSATPIPRTYALTIFGDMDVSTIKQRPKGRQKIDTYVKKNSEIKDVLEMMFKELKAGHQVYVIAPLIEESENSDLTNVNDLKDKMTMAFGNHYKIDIVHGKMASGAKDLIMNQFKNNEVQILISTTVVEVGVDVPNATTMAIFDADRFGLSTLHQLRGRVGRGTSKSQCILISDSDAERLKIMEREDDGFVISEEDFKLRGHGDLFGTKQSGDMTFKIANIKNDYKILLQAKKDSKEYLLDKETDNDLLKKKLIDAITEG